jgi:hypothetical protein
MTKENNENFQIHILFDHQHTFEAPARFCKVVLHEVLVVLHSDFSIDKNEIGNINSVLVFFLCNTYLIIFIK